MIKLKYKIKLFIKKRKTEKDVLDIELLATSQLIRSQLQGLNNNSKKPLKNKKSNKVNFENYNPDVNEYCSPVLKRFKSLNVNNKHKFDSFVMIMQEIKNFRNV